MAFADIEVMGNLGSDPEMRYTPAGKAVTQFSVAVNHSKKDRQSGEWVDEGTDWFRVSVWGDQAERFAEQLRKGSKVLVKGRFKTREWESDKTGAKGLALEVSADRIVDLTPRARDEGAFDGAPARQAASTPRARDDDADLDDLPF